MTRYILALDQGTTSSRAILFDHAGQMISVGQREFPQLTPAPGEVEHDPEAIWQTQCDVAREALATAGVNGDQVAAIGITNQRETIVLWDRVTGKPIDNALVWQSRVSAPICERLKQAGHEALFRRKTGLLLDPYFSGTKVCHLFEKHPGLRERAARGEVLFGTIDSFLIWRLTQGKSHVTDVTNACRTLMLNLETLEWDDELLEVLDIPRAMLPEVRPSSGVLGETDLLGVRTPITGCAGDQQAATFGQTCFDIGDAKNTYGTGCFLLLNAGERPPAIPDGLLATVGWQVGGRTTYCLEGSVFIAGAVVQWLRDGLGLVKESKDIEALAAQVSDTGDVYFVPAFVGLGAPYWDPYARGTIVGLTRGTTAAHLALAALESMAYQSRDVLEAMQAATRVSLAALRVDGGASVNARLIQFQADLLGVPVQRPAVAETTALGAAYLAGLEVGYWQNLDDLRRNWQRSAEFQPQWDATQRDARYARWQRAVGRATDWVEH